MALCGVFLWLASIQHSSILWNLLAILAVLVSLRILAAVAVRTSIQVGVKSCHEAIQHLHQDNLVLVGFSWGGAVGCLVLLSFQLTARSFIISLHFVIFGFQVIAALLAQQQQLSTRKRLKVLLIAPTTSLVSSIAMQQDTALQVPCNESIHVVHGTQDLAFCPHQDRWSGQNVHRLLDNHVFFQPSSQRFLKTLLIRLLDESLESSDK